MDTELQNKERRLENHNHVICSRNPLTVIKNSRLTLTELVYQGYQYKPYYNVEIKVASACPRSTLCKLQPQSIRMHLPDKSVSCY